jgi:hypothetical protein
VTVSAPAARRGRAADQPTAAPRERPAAQVVHGSTASTALAPLVLGDPRPVRVIAAFDRALYLEHPGGLLAIETSDGVQLPNGVVLARPSSDRLLGGRHLGAGGAVGGGILAVGDLRVRVVRWRRARPVLRPTPPPVLAGRLAAAHAHLVRRRGPAPTWLAVPMAELVAALRADDAPAATAVARRSLLGRGPGLTPAGDDLLAGLLAGVAPLAAATSLGPHPLLEVVAATADAVADAAPAVTTALSASLLRHAAACEVAAPAAAVLAALTGSGSLVPALDRLLEVGSTSGRDLALGLLAATELVLHAYPAPRGRP